jgi:hypothetical protein
MDESQVLEKEQQSPESQEAPEPIRNPEAVLQALNAAKAQKEKERERAAALEAQIAEMNKQLEEQRLETAKRDQVLQKLMESIAPDAAAVATTAPEMRGKGQSQNPMLQVLEQFNAEKQIEEMRRRYVQEGEQRAAEKYRPDLDAWQRKAAEAEAASLQLRQQIKFSEYFAAAGGKATEQDGFFKLYGDRFAWDDTVSDFVAVKDGQGNTILNNQGRPMKVTEALLNIRRGSLEDIPYASMARNAFEDYNQASGGGTPTSTRRVGNKTVRVYATMQDAINKNPKASPAELARQLRDGEIMLGE